MAGTGFTKQYTKAKTKTALAASIEVDEADVVTKILWTVYYAMRAASHVEKRANGVLSEQAIS